MAFGMLWNLECVVTNGAGKWFLTCVDPFMALGICCIVNVLSHMEQANGFSPVWILSWLLGCCRILNGLPHIEQAKGFLLV